MSWTDLGLPTCHIRAETWECDIHRHWSTRFFCRTFQSAAESCAVLTGRTIEDAAVETRHVRFYREVLEADAVSVHSFALSDEAGSGTAHVLLRNGALSATAFDSTAPVGLPDLPVELTDKFRPRGLGPTGTPPWIPDPAIDFLTVLGPASFLDLRGQSHGRLTFEDYFLRMSYASQHHFSQIGFSGDFTRAHGIGRMVAELRFQRFGSMGQGEVVCGASRLTSVTQRTFVSSHLLYAQSGNPLALIDLCCLAVDLKTRRVTQVPSFVSAGMPANLRQLRG